jgi:hypothetical protein
MAFQIFKKCSFNSFTCKNKFKLISLKGKNHAIGLIISCYLTYTGYFSNTKDSVNFLKDFSDFRILESCYAIATSKYLKLFTNSLRLPLPEVKMLQIERIMFNKFPFDHISPFFIVKQQSKVLYSSKETHRTFNKQSAAEFCLNIEDCSVSGDFILCGYSMNQDSFKLIFRCALNTMEFTNEGVFNIPMKNLDLFESMDCPFSMKLEYQILKNDENYKSQLVHSMSNSPVYLKKHTKATNEQTPTIPPQIGTNLSSLISELKKKFFGDYIVNDEPMLIKKESKKRKNIFEESNVAKSPKTHARQKNPKPELELLDMSFESEIQSFKTPIKTPQKLKTFEEQTNQKVAEVEPLLDFSFEKKEENVVQRQLFCLTPLKNSPMPSSGSVPPIAPPLVILTPKLSMVPPPPPPPLTPVMGSPPPPLMCPSPIGSSPMGPPTLTSPSKSISSIHSNQKRRTR